MKRSAKKMLEDGKFRIGTEGYLKQEWVPSGSLSLDYILGGGYPKGKIVEIYGDPSSGKSLLAQMAEANVTQQGLYVLHEDLEGNYLTDEMNQWRESFGVDMDKVFCGDPRPAEDVINDSCKLIESLGPELGLVIVDSIGMLESGKDLEKEAGEHTVGKSAKLMAQYVRKLNMINRHAAIILLNHTYSVIGGYVPRKETNGGSKVKYGCSIRVELNSTPIFDKKEFEGATGLEIKAFTKKNKVAPPFRTAKLLFDFETMSFDQVDEVVKLCIGLDIVVKNHASYSYEFDGEEVKVKGVDNLKDFVRDNPSHFEFLRGQVFKELK